MAYKFVDRAQMSVSGAPGTGPISLATALNGYQSIYGPNGLSNGDTFRYLAVDPSGAWEIGIGTYSSTGNTVTRSPTKSSAPGNAAVTLSSNAAIACTFAAEDISTGSLAGLQDVNVTEGAMIDTYSLVWDNATGKWIAAPGASTSTLAGLSDVALTSPSNHQALLYVTADTKWENVSLASVALSGAYSALTGAPTIPTNTSFNLAGLGDVSITTGSGVDGYSVTWNNAAGKFELANISGGGGGGGVTVENSGTSVGTGITTLNFAGMATVTASGSTATITGNSGGGGGGSSPTIVQQQAFCQDAPFTLASAPTPGNLLIAIISHWSQSTTLAGWIDLSHTNASGDYIDIFMRVAQSGDTTTIAPSNGNNGCSAAIFEIAGAAFAQPSLINTKVDSTSTSQSLNIYCAPTSLLVGLISSQTTTNSLPSAVSGATAGTGATASSGVGSGYPRTAQDMTATISTGGNVTVSATYATSADCNMGLICIQGAGTV